MDDTYHLTIEIPGLPRMNASDNVNWRRRLGEKRRWERAVWVAVRQQRLPDAPLERARVRYTRFSSRPPDYTNLVAGFKYIEDGLVRCGVLLDDSPANVINEYRWEAARQRQGRIRVEVWGLAPVSPGTSPGPSSAA